MGYSTKLAQLEQEFHPGVIYGVAGSNGAGKSTLLKTLAGEIHPLDSTVTIGGDDATSTKAIGKVISIATPDFYPDLSIGEHLKLLERTGFLGYDEAVETWALGDIVEFSPSQVSSGQQQRSFLASQLGLSSEVYLLDEPERHLDSNRVEVLCDVLENKAANDAIVIIASHSTRILSLCHETIQL